MNAAKQRTCHVDCHGVVFLQCIDEVVHVVHVGDLDAKTINHQAKCDVLSDVAPETRSMLALALPFDGKAFFELLIYDDAGLGKTRHPLPDFDVDPAVRSDNLQRL
jgi:hypothetical protein